MSGLDDVDTAAVAPCPGGCGTMVRRFALTPISGNGLDQVPSGPWWCPKCIQAKCVAARQTVRPVEDTLL